jgi:hypothetical protein
MTGGCRAALAPGSPMDHWFSMTNVKSAGRRAGQSPALRPAAAGQRPSASLHWPGGRDRVAAGRRTAAPPCRLPALPPRSRRIASTHRPSPDRLPYAAVWKLERDRGWRAGSGGRRTAGRAPRRHEEQLLLALREPGRAAPGRDQPLGEGDDDRRDRRHHRHRPRHVSQPVPPSYSAYLGHGQIAHSTPSALPATTAGRRAYLDDAIRLLITR